MEGIGSFLPDFLSEIVSNDETTLIFLDELWPQIVGRDLALRCRPVRLARKRLVVAVPTEIWKNELMEMRQMLIQAINRFWKVRLVEKVEFEIRLLEGDLAP